MRNKIDWIILYEVNGSCDNTENSYIQSICNTYTNEMINYGHMEFQMVLNLGAAEIMRLLNNLGERVQSGERFKDGVMISDLYLDCSVRLNEFINNGHKVLRLIIPDKYNIFPEDIKLQLLTNEQLKKWRKCNE